MRTRALAAAAAVAAIALPGAAAETAGAKTSQSITLSVPGAKQTLSACGGSHATTTAPRGTKAAAAVTLAEPPGRRKGGRHARLVVERCESGHWRPLSKRSFGSHGAYERVRRYRLALPSASSADLRVRASVAGDRHRRPAKSPFVYLRVGVGELVDVPVSFQVDNLNRTSVPCTPDGKRYMVAGHLMAPRSVLDKGARTVTIYLHGIEISDKYFRYRGVPGYDFQTEMAELGHASVVIDRLGHGDSSLVPVGATCVGSQADVAHQVVDKLRSGDYRTADTKGLAFKKVALAGHSFGSFMAEIAAQTFKNEDALVLMSFAAEGIDAAVLADRQARGEAGSCTTGGGFEKTPGGPTGYAYLWPDREIWGTDTFFNAVPKVVEDSKDLRERSPCGDINSSVPAGLSEPHQYNGITVPVVLIIGKQDKLFPPPAGEKHRLLFTGSKDVTFHEIDGAGHTLMLQRTAPEFRKELSDWLAARGY
jgi:pimeloyl-ACP methyl ester carboxylesterase